MTDQPPYAFDRDYFAWTQEQARILRNLAEIMPELPLDTLHLAEEVAGLGRAEHQRLVEALELLTLCLIKLENSAARAPRKEWRNLAAVERRRAQRIVRASPSMIQTTALDELFLSARMIAAADLAREGGFDGALPFEMPYTLSQLLDDMYWPANRHGLGG